VNRAVMGAPSEGVVLRHLLGTSVPQTRPETAEACHLSKPTVFAAMERLEALGLVAPVAQRSGLPGRSPSLYAVPAEVGFVAGIDIGGANLRVTVWDLHGRTVAEQQRRTQVRGGAHVVRQAVALLDKTIASAGRSGRLLCVGVAVPGAVDRTRPLVRYAWNVGQEAPYDFQTKLAKAIDAPVLLENNVNLAAVGEQAHGAAQRLDTFAVVAVGAGIGAGIVHEGSLLRGANGAAGEVARLPSQRMHPRDESTHEDVAGGAALLRAAQHRSDWHDGVPEDLVELFRRAADGEEPALTLVEDECRRVTDVIASLCAVVDPGTVILTGGLGENDFLVNRVTALTREHVGLAPTILRSQLGARASLVGAAVTAVEHAKEELIRLVDRPRGPSATHLTAKG
jgi:glucokinase